MTDRNEVHFRAVISREPLARPVAVAPAVLLPVAVLAVPSTTVPTRSSEGRLPVASTGCQRANGAQMRSPAVLQLQCRLERVRQSYYKDSSECLHTV